MFCAPCIPVYYTRHTLRISSISDWLLSRGISPAVILAAHMITASQAGFSEGTGDTPERGTTALDHRTGHFPLVAARVPHLREYRTVEEYRERDERASTDGAIDVPHVTCPRWFGACQPF